MKVHIVDFYKKSVNEKGEDVLKLLGTVKFIEEENVSDQIKLSPIGMAFRKAPPHCLDADFYKINSEYVKRDVPEMSQNIQPDRILSANDFPKREWG